MARLRMLKEGPDPLRSLLQIAEPAYDGAQEVFRAVHERTGDTVVLHVIPDKLIRIEFGGTGWQEEQWKPSLERLDKGCDLPGPMRGVSVTDEEDRAVAALHEAL